MSRQDFGAWWSAVGSAELKREMQAALGSVDDYDVVGSPSGALRAEIRAGDVLVRVEGGRTLVARVTAPGLHGAQVFPPGTEAEGEGDGLYAEAFACYGLDVTTLNPEGAAERVRVSDCRVTRTEVFAECSLLSRLSAAST